MAWYIDGPTAHNSFENVLSQHSVAIPPSLSGQSMRAGRGLEERAPGGTAVEEQRAVSCPVGRAWWLALTHKYVLLCWLCGGLTFLLGLMFLLICFLLRSRTSSLGYFETVPSYVPACVMMVTGGLLVSFVKRKNRFNYLIHLAAVCCLMSAILCVVVTIATTVVHMARLQLITECVYARSLHSCTCFAGRLPSKADGTEVSFVFSSVANCETVHGVLYTCLRALFGVSVGGILLCLFSAMLIYQLTCHERKRLYWEQLHVRRRQLLANHTPFPPSFCHSEPWTRCSVADTIDWWPHSVSAVHIGCAANTVASNMTLIDGSSVESPSPGCCGLSRFAVFGRCINGSTRLSTRDGATSATATVLTSVDGSNCPQTRTAGVTMRRSYRSNDAVFQHLAAGRQARYSCPPLLSPLWQHWEPPPPYSRAQHSQSAVCEQPADGPQTVVAAAASGSAQMNPATCHAATSSEDDRPLRASCGPQTFSQPTETEEQPRPDAHDCVPVVSGTCGRLTAKMNEGNINTQMTQSNCRQPSIQPAQNRKTKALAEHEKPTDNLPNRMDESASLPIFLPMFSSGAHRSLSLQPLAASMCLNGHSGRPSVDELSTSSSSSAESATVSPPSSSSTSNQRDSNTDAESSQSTTPSSSNEVDMAPKNSAKSVEDEFTPSNVLANVGIVCGHMSVSAKPRSALREQADEQHYEGSCKWQPIKTSLQKGASAAHFVPNHILPKSSNCLISASVDHLDAKANYNVFQSKRDPLQESTILPQQMDAQLGASTHPLSSDSDTALYFQYRAERRFRRGKPISRARRLCHYESRQSRLSRSASVTLNSTDDFCSASVSSSQVIDDSWPTTAGCDSQLATSALHSDTINDHTLSNDDTDEETEAQTCHTSQTLSSRQITWPIKHQSILVASKSYCCLDNYEFHEKSGKGITSERSSQHTFDRISQSQPVSPSRANVCTNMNSLRLKGSIFPHESSTIYNTVNA